MNKVIINLDAINHNVKEIHKWISDHNATWTLVSKVLCGNLTTLTALHDMGINSMADSRLDNMRVINDIDPSIETWYLRLPHKHVIDDVVALADVSLNSETEIISELNTSAQRQNKIHKIIVMIELGDLREGILPGSLVKFYTRIFELPNINVIGIGANLGCLSGAVPNIDQLAQLGLYRELLELKFGRKLPLISAGSSAVLPLLHSGQVPKSMNHFRIGESVFLGTDLINNSTLEGLRDDGITLEAEIAEIKVKSLVPVVETSSLAPFDSPDSSDITPGQRGYRAIVTVGQLDTDVSGLTPINVNHRIAGASSDLMVINLGDTNDGLTVGDTIRFRPNYAAMLRLMMDQYIPKEIISSASNVKPVQYLDSDTKQIISQKIIAMKSKISASNLN